MNETNIDELIMTCIDMGHGTRHELAVSVPVSVSYYDSYPNPAGGEVRVIGTKLSRYGSPIITLSADGVGDRDEIRLDEVMHFIRTDGSAITMEDYIARLNLQGHEALEAGLLNGYKPYRILQENEIDHIEIAIRGERLG